MSYDQYWQKIFSHSEEMNSLITSYWNEHNNIGTWQFWTVVFLLVFPLILLYFTVDRSRVFELFFFGYTVHVLWAYTDIVLQRYSYFVHTYFIAPVFPYALNMTASALPVGFLLLYQYCTNHKKNFLIYSLVLGAVFAFGLASLERLLGMVKLGKGMNLFYIFLIDTAICYIAYFFTKVIQKWSHAKKL